jgi:LysM repeat protein
MLHRNTLIAVSILLCVVAVGAGLFVANLNKQSGLITQQPGVSATAQPPTATAAQPTPDADTPAVATAAPAVALDPTALPETPQPEPTSEPAATAAAPDEAPAYIEYTVQKGDLLNNIAKKYNVTTKDILAINEISNADSLTVGQVLRIPRI